MAVICCPLFSNNAQILTNSFSHFVTLSRYPATSPCTAVPGNLLWCCSRPSRDRVDRKSHQRARQTTGANIKFFAIHLYCINMPQLFTFIRGILCSSVKRGNRLRCGRPNYRCSFSVISRLLCSNPHIPDLIQERTNIPFKGHHGLFLLRGETTKSHTHYCGLRSGSHVENSQYLI
jgi:hypothetical protein